MLYLSATCAMMLTVSLFADDVNGFYLRDDVNGFFVADAVRGLLALALRALLLRFKEPEVKLADSDGVASPAPGRADTLDERRAPLTVLRDAVKLMLLLLLLLPLCSRFALGVPGIAGVLAVVAAAAVTSLSCLFGFPSSH